MTGRGRDLMSEHDDFADDAAAYVLGALDEPEVTRFQRHLDTCVVCRDEVASLRGVVAALPLAAPPQVPPRRLARDIKRKVRASPRPAQARARRRSPLLRPAVAGAVALAVAGGAFATVEVTGSESTRVVPAHVIASAGSAELRLRDGHAELVVRKLPPPPNDKIYEVWLARPGRPPAPTSALFNVTSSGSGAVDVPGDLRGVNQVLVTPEPLGGSRVPTHAPVISVTL